VAGTYGCFLFRISLFISDDCRWKCTPEGEGVNAQLEATVDRIEKTSKGVKVIYGQHGKESLVIVESSRIIVILTELYNFSVTVNVEHFFDRQPNHL